MNKNIKTLSLVLLLSNAMLVTTTAFADAPKTDAPKTSTAPVKADSAKHSGDIKIAVVSATEIMVDTDAGKKASEKIDAKRQKYGKEIQDRAIKVNKDEQDLAAKSPTMSAESQRTATMKIANAKQDLELDQKKWMQELQADAQTEMEALGKEFDQAVQKIAKEAKLDMVLEKESGRLIYAADHLNVTDSVKVAMNTQFRATQMAATKKDQGSVKATA